jgi:hypothetical protein
MPAFTWLAYLNKKSFPTGQAFATAVRTLASKVDVTCDQWDYTHQEILQVELEERRDRFLEAFIAFAQGQLFSEEGAFARNYLTKVVGLPPNRLVDLEIGLYTAPDLVRQAMRDSGFDTPDDTNRGEVLGLFHPRWEGRIVGPWWDIKGERVINVWRRFPGPTPMDHEVYTNLFRPDPGQPFGGRETPVGLHIAKRLGKNKLVLMESPVKALLAYASGLLDPFPVATAGIPTVAQVEELGKFLRRSGSVTINLDYFPNAKDPHARTIQALRNFQNSPITVYALDPIEMASAGSHTKEVCPASYIRSNGIQGYRALISRRVPLVNYFSHANVLEYSPKDRKAAETPKDLLEGFESFIDDLDVKQRVGGLETVSDSIQRHDMEDFEDTVPRVDEKGGSPRADADPAKEVYERLLPEIRSLLAGLGKAQMPAEGLLADMVRMGEAGGRQPKVDEAAAKVNPPFPSQDPGSAGGPQITPRREISAMTSNIEKGFEKIAGDIAAGTLSPEQGVIILMKCHEGIHTILSSILEKIDKGLYGA